jgi:hypothetical protein
MTLTTKNGRPPTAPVSAEEYQPPKRRGRRVLLASEISDRQVAALREAEVPTGFAELDAELENWKP